MKNSYKIQIFLPTYNRPEYILDAVNSILNQTFNDYELIISDNSDNYLSMDIISNSSCLDLPNVKYIKRDTMGPLDHLRQILSEVKSECFMIFHDDDLMFPNMLQDLYFELTKKSDKPVVAVGGNALLLKDNQATNKNYMSVAPNTGHTIISEKPKDLALMYMNNNNCPFDSYLYKSIVAKKITFDERKGGKYCDCSYLLDINCIGNIVILARPLMYLRLHSSQDSRAHSLSGRIKLLSHIKKVTENSMPHNKIKEFQLYNVYGQYCKKILNGCFEYFSPTTLKISILLFKYRRFDWLVKMHLKALMIKFNNLIFTF